MRRQISSLKSMTLLSNLGVWEGFCVQERGQIVFGIWLWSGPVCYDVWLPLGLQIRLMSVVHHYRGDGGIKRLQETLFACMEWKMCYCIQSQSCFSKTCVIGLPERCSSLSTSDFFPASDHSNLSSILVYRTSRWNRLRWWRARLSVTYQYRQNPSAFSDPERKRNMSAWQWTWPPANS
jgi:hypothetical protein